MPCLSKLSPEEWAEARRMRGEGATYVQVAARFKVTASTIGGRARREAWPRGVSASLASKDPIGSSVTADIRSRLAQRLYGLIECNIKLMELRMQKQLEIHQADPGGPMPPASTRDERESFAALIDSINKVTEMASEPAPAAAGRGSPATAAATGAGAVNPELTALSDDIDPDGLAAASEKDALRRDIAERLAKLFPAS
jgi:hypothetical protein